MNHRSISLLPAIAVASSLFAECAHCQLYKWKDASGNTHYSDTPPEGPEGNDAKEQPFPDLITYGQSPAADIESDESAPGSHSLPTIGPFDPAVHNACISKVKSESDDVLALDNGAIMEITYQFLGFLGFYPDALVFYRIGGWNIWIEGKQVFNANLLQSPVTCLSPIVYLIDSVTANGTVIVNNIAYSVPSSDSPFGLRTTHSQSDCSDWKKGEHVVLHNNSGFESCHPTLRFASSYTRSDTYILINLDREEICELHCR
jgi:hypothetical protein